MPWCYATYVPVLNLEMRAKDVGILGKCVCIVHGEEFEK